MKSPARKVLVLALDIGTSSTRSALFDEKARVIIRSEARQEYSVRYSKDGAAELSPARLLQANRACLRETLQAHRSSRFRELPIAAIGGSAFWHSLLGLDGNGRPLTPIFTWADSRCAGDAARLREQFDERKIQAETGCPLRFSYWPAKLRWLRRTDRQRFGKVCSWVSPADWIFAELFGGAGSSPSMASGTGLYDLRTESWHAGLLEACQIDTQKLTGISDAPSSAIAPRALRGAPVFRAVGDGASGNLGCGADRAGRLAINLGTSAAVRMMETGTADRGAIPSGLFRYVVDAGRTVFGGAVSNAGNLRRWGARELRMEEVEEKTLDRRAAADDHLDVLPFWVTERAPTWPEELSGTIAGLTQSTKAAEIFRATTCATFYRLAEILASIESQKGRTKQIIVSGGATRSPALMALLADALGRDLSVAATESSLRGAACFALEKLGHGRPPDPRRASVRHDRRLTQKHRVRRRRQAELETRLS
jgi:gluconokinase